jgi:hypothetical protein
MSRQTLFLLAGILSAPFCLTAQTVDGKVKLQQAQQIAITLETKTTIAQQAMGQSIDFNVDAGSLHQYNVTNTTEDNHSLRHTVKRISFKFDGMGQKQAFNSDNPKDLNGQMGKPVKELLDKKYDMIIDPYGKVKLAMPESFPNKETDSRMAIISSMMKEVVEVVQPPKAGKSSFFRVIPEKEGGVKVGESWTESGATLTDKYETTYVLTAVTDSTVLVDFTGTANTVTKAEMMGSETTTTLSHKLSGKIILDKATMIIKEKTTTTESTGTTESTFGNLPLTSKSTSVITVLVKAGE